MSNDELTGIAEKLMHDIRHDATADEAVAVLESIRSEALQDAAAYVLANAKIKNSCCAETRASIYALIKGMDQK